MFTFWYTSLKLYPFFILYNIVLVNAIHQHESATGMYVSPPSWNSLPTPTPSHSSRLSQSPGLSLSDTANPHWHSVLHVVMYTFPFYSLNSSHRLLSSLHPQVCSLCLHLHNCPGDRFVSNIFLDCIHRVNMQYLSFSFWFPSLCTVGSRFIHFVKIASSWFHWSSTYFVSIF